MNKNQLFRLPAISISLFTLLSTATLIEHGDLKAQDTSRFPATIRGRWVVDHEETLKTLLKDKGRSEYEKLNRRFFARIQQEKPMALSVQAKRVTMNDDHYRITKTEENKNSVSIVCQAIRKNDRDISAKEFRFVLRENSLSLIAQHSTEFGTESYPIVLRKLRLPIRDAFVGKWRPDALLTEALRNSSIRSTPRSPILDAFNSVENSYLISVNPDGVSFHYCDEEISLPILDIEDKKIAFRFEDNVWTIEASKSGQLHLRSPWPDGIPIAYKACSADDFKRLLMDETETQLRIANSAPVPDKVLTQLPKKLHGEWYFDVTETARFEIAKSSEMRVFIERHIASLLGKTPLLIIDENGHHLQQQEIRLKGVKAVASNDPDSHYRLLFHGNEIRLSMVDDNTALLSFGFFEDLVFKKQNGPAPYIEREYWGHWNLDLAATRQQLAAYVKQNILSEIMAKKISQKLISYPSTISISKYHCGRVSLQDNIQNRFRVQRFESVNPKGKRLQFALQDGLRADVKFVGKNQMMVSFSKDNPFWVYERHEDSKIPTEYLGTWHTNVRETLKARQKQSPNKQEESKALTEDLDKTSFQLEFNKRAAVEKFYKSTTKYEITTYSDSDKVEVLLRNPSTDKYKTIKLSYLKDDLNKLNCDRDGEIYVLERKNTAGDDHLNRNTIPIRLRGSWRLDVNETKKWQLDLIRLNRIKLQDVTVDLFQKSKPDRDGFIFEVGRNSFSTSKDAIRSKAKTVSRVEEQLVDNWFFEFPKSEIGRIKLIRDNLIIVSGFRNLDASMDWNMVFRKIDK